MTLKGLLEFNLERSFMPKVTDYSPNMGCDPEFFFKFKGEIVGAEKFLPKTGLTVGGYGSKFIIDGVQAELNPAPNTCRASLANELVCCFFTLVAELKKTGKEGFTADFSRTIEISKEHLMELEESSRKFGCAPSKSIYKRTVGMKIEDVDPVKYRTRAAGGHIHIGKDSYDTTVAKALTEDCEKTVTMLDLIVGNTCVLIDRDAGNIERRRVYGKAGEYRLPKHGLEYRTLSNFWLTSYPLMSMAFGLVRFAVQIMASSHKEALYKAFTSKVKAGNVKRAINYNDFDLAMENFKSIEDLIVDTVASNTERYAIHGGNIKDFHHFVDMINQLGLNYWFPQDPVEHWTTIGECHKGGFHDYLVGHVRKDKAKQEAEVLATKDIKAA